MDLTKISCLDELIKRAEKPTIDEYWKFYEIYLDGKDFLASIQEFNDNLLQEIQGTTDIQEIMQLQDKMETVKENRIKSKEYYDRVMNFYNNEWNSESGAVSKEEVGSLISFSQNISRETKFMLSLLRQTLSTAYNTGD